MSSFKSRSHGAHRSPRVFFSLYLSKTIAFGEALVLALENAHNSAYEDNGLLYIYSKMFIKLLFFFSSLLFIVVVVMQFVFRFASSNDLDITVDDPMTPEIEFFFVFRMPSGKRQIQI